MKKLMLLTLAAGLVTTTQLQALDLYISGSTAFRANVHDACKNLFDSPPVSGSTLRYGSAAQGGNGASNNGNNMWTMTGTVGNKVSALGSTPLTIHANFNGSVQGISLAQSPATKIFFIDTSGNQISNSVTIGFTDCSSGATPFPASGNYSEEAVAVQPFVMCRSVPNISVDNVTWEQLRYASQAGRIPLSAFTGHFSDHGSFIYELERTKDSGTRRTQFAGVQFGYNQSAVIYNFDATNNVFYKATNTMQAIAGGVSNGVSYGVVGSAGSANANLNWGSGYVAGGDIRTALSINNAANQSIAYLSFADAKTGFGGTTTNWGQVISFEGLWPTAAGFGVRGNTGTNDLSPITTGIYPNWGYEIVVFPVVAPSSLATDQNLSQTQLGDQNTTGTILGVLDAVTVGTPVLGSIDNEIENTKIGGATAIRINDMVSSRASVGGTITP